MPKAKTRSVRRARHQIYLGPPIATIVDQVIKVLATADVYQRGGGLADAVRDAEVGDDIVRPSGTPRVRLMPTARLVEVIDREIEFLRARKSETGTTWVPARPPADVVAAVAARGEWLHIRPLAGVIEYPVLRRDGSVLDMPGYDFATGLIVARKRALRVPSAPTRSEAMVAVRSLLDVVADFPFVGPEHRCVWVIALLTVLARPAIDGPTPLILIDAADRGTGKTLLADIIGFIVSGRMLPRRAAPDEAAEWRKAMLALAIAGDPIVLIDNVTRALRSDVLDMVLTGSEFRERVLGRNQEMVLPIRTVFITTLNNAVVSTDLVRRSLHCRMDAGVERPERRTGFAHDPLLPWVLRERDRLLRAALTVLRAYHHAGRPQVSMRSMGSYDAWSAVVRAAVIWAGLPDPAVTQDGLREDADEDRNVARGLLRALHESRGDAPFTAAAVAADAAVADATSALRVAVESTCNGQVTAKALGYRLRRLRRAVVAGLRLVRAGDDPTGSALWRVEQVDPGDWTDPGQHVPSANGAQHHLDDPDHLGRLSENDDIERAVIQDVREEP